MNNVIETTYSDGTKSWYTEGFIKETEKYIKRDEYYWWFLWKKEHDIIRKKREYSKRDLKYCYIYVGKTQFLAWCDITSNIVYKADGYNNTWMVWKHYIFIKFTTMMEL